MTASLVATTTRTVALDYGWFDLRGGESAHDLDLMPLLDAAMDSDTGVAAANGRVVLVLSPHQNNFELELTVEVWDSEPSLDTETWQQVVRSSIEVVDDQLLYFSPDGHWEPIGVPSGSYAVLVSGRGFVAHGWPGTTTPGDIWRVRLWPGEVSASVETIRTWTPPPPPPPPIVDPPQHALFDPAGLASLDPAVRAVLPADRVPSMADVHAAMAEVYGWDEEQIERSRRIRDGLEP